MKVEHTDDLPDFNKKLYEVVGLNSALKHRVCPIDVTAEGETNRCAIVLLETELRTDLTDTLVANLRDKGWTIESDAYYLASPSVMDELARDGINEFHKAGKGGTTRKFDSALWSLFESAGEFALNNGSSDIHIRINKSKEDSQIMFRIDGRITKPREFVVKTDRLLAMTAYVYNMHSSAGSENIFNENAPQQCQVNATIQGVKVQFRWASNKTARGTKVVMRVIIQDSETAPKTLAELGYLPPQIDVWERAITRLGGGILIGGVVNSGKSTTLQTALSMMPDWMEIITAEDPVENLIPNTDQFSVSRSLNSDDGDPFIAVKRQTKRMDPDAVMIAEIRDHDSASMFRDVAESGHRALATLHAPSAIDMITLRLVSSELGIPREVIATPGFINLLVYQALVPKLCPCCRLDAEAVYDDKYLDRIERLFQVSRKSLKAQNPRGCEQCLRTSLPELAGTKGRLVVAEMIEPTTRMLLLFREAKNLELKRYIRKTRTARFDEQDTTGKSALEVAMYHVAHGVLDPREVERKFGTFEQYETEMAEDQGTRSSAVGVKRLVGTFAVRPGRRLRRN
ncbi:GspE/PulE family protein [Massilia sp. LjRoot122]|uniref:GspE/PulE family protein n=1 Tax=Massilia sp. LjRoot122 TaxID=3342257 RepID=UPI003ECF4D25